MDGWIDATRDFLLLKEAKLNVCHCFVTHICHPSTDDGWMELLSACLNIQTDQTASFDEKQAETMLSSKRLPVENVLFQTGSAASEEILLACFKCDKQKYLSDHHFKMLSMGC